MKKFLFWLNRHDAVRGPLVGILKKLRLYIPVVNIAIRIMYGPKQPHEHSPNSGIPIRLLGQSFISEQLWFDRSAFLRNHLGDQVAQIPTDQKKVSTAENVDYKIAVIVSLFRSDAYLARFLSNLESQTIFHESEIVISAVSASAFEREALELWGLENPNVKVDFVEARIGIYEAWNNCIRSSTAPYLTNANADDIRDPRSLELQVLMLDNHEWADVTWQDVYISLDYRASWNEISSVGVRTDSPPVTTDVLMRNGNMPHNAPAWRRALHESVGYFDESFVSAADADFWLRCSLSGSKFIKAREVHAGYFINPQGLSTESSSPGLREWNTILERHRGKLNQVTASRKKMISFETVLTEISALQVGARRKGPGLK